MVAAFQFWGSEKNRVCNLYAFFENSHLSRVAFDARFLRLTRMNNLAPARTCPHAVLAAKRVPGVQGWLRRSHPSGFSLDARALPLGFSPGMKRWRVPKAMF